MKQFGYLTTHLAISSVVYEGQYLAPEREYVRVGVTLWVSDDADVVGILCVWVEDADFFAFQLAIILGFFICLK